MSVITKIISIVLKSVADNKISNELAKELVGVSIDEASEIGIKKIKDFIIGEKAKIDNILSRDNMITIKIQENHIDYVVAEIKDLFSKIDIKDEVLRQCKYDSTKLKDYFWDEYSVSKSDYIESESDIKKGLYAVSEAILKLVSESEEFEKNVLIQISNAVDDIRSEEQTHFENIMKRFDKVDESNNALFNKVSDNSNVNKNIKLQEKVKSRTQGYADKWDDNMFLNNFDEWDEKAGVNVKLRDLYIDAHLPHFIWGDNTNESTNLNELLLKYINKNKEIEMLLILGQPGIGKSTLITWIIANFPDQTDEIWVYKFASDLKNVNWWADNVCKEIFKNLGLEFDDLNGKTVIIDGFDEINVGKNRRDVLNLIYWELINIYPLKNFSLIVTCRENYIEKLENIQFKYITLQPWDEEQIISFCSLFQEKTKNNISENTIEKLLENKNILGIPLILYMVLALNISIEKEGSIVDVYDKIFSLDGGIYDRCIENKNFADKHRIGQIKKQVHQISRDIAIWMFENNADEAYILQEEYQKICATIIQEENDYIRDDFLIGNYFKLVRHCEGIETQELFFIHRSIYEYFVVETIYNSIENVIIELSEEGYKEFAGKISIYLKQGLITNTIGEYLHFKLLKLYNRLSIRKRECFYQWWENAIDYMMGYGMFYYTSSNIKDYKAIIDKEIQCFYNLIKILKLLQETCKRKYILADANKKQLEKYIRFRLIMRRIEANYRTEIFDLSNFNLEGINFSGEDLRQVSLSKAKLNNANLSKTDLREQDLRETDLEKANLEEANLVGANLVGANLMEAKLCDAQLDTSRWNLRDIIGILPRLELAKFTYIIIEDQEQKILYKRKLFPDKKD